MLTSLHLKNYRAFDELELELAPVTVIMGPNNSGKSSIISAIRLLVQTVESLDPEVPLLLNGIMGDLGTFKDTVYRNYRGRPFEIGFSAPIRNIRHSRKQFLTTDPLLYWQEQTENILELRLAFKYRAKRRELILDSTELTKYEGEYGESLLATDYSEDTERQSVTSIGGIPIPPTLKKSLSGILRIRNFIPIFTVPFMSKDYRIKEPPSSPAVVLEDLLGPRLNNVLRDIENARDLSRTLSNTEYIGAMRIPPSRLYSFTGERRRRVGAAGENAANILAMDQSRTRTKSNQIASAVEKWLSQSNIASNFKVEPTSDSFYEIRVQHPETQEYENLADVGLGSSQIMPILVGGYNLSSGSTYLVEEPEIHLHPKAQSELGSFFLDMYTRGVQSIIETHSEHLVLRLQQYVADRKISPKDVRFYFVHAENGKKVVKALLLDNMGMFQDEWPGGFFPERLSEAKNLARIRARNNPEN